MPTVGFLSSLSEAASTHLISAWRRGLSETGYLEGKTVAVEYRFADGQYDRVPAFAAEFVRRGLSLVLAAGPPAALAAKIATTTIPIVFIVGLDPVAAGLVASLNHPGGNATGMTLITGPAWPEAARNFARARPQNEAHSHAGQCGQPGCAP
jgi:putative ABC transport system substrate-binding protein